MGMLTGSEVEDWDGRVKGKVIFADTGEPATGASVIVKGTTEGTITDSEGRFELECKKDDILVISFVGYETVEMKASWITDKAIELEFRSYELDLSKVKQKQKLTVKEREGKIGIRISDSNDSEIEPVIVIDGKVVEDFENVDPENIWSVEVVKDQSSEIVKKYKAKNGVIIITMKESIDEEKRKEIFTVVEEMPEFPGGVEALKSYINDKLEYPESAKKQGIEGKVTVEFIIDKEGNPENINIFRSTHEVFNTAAISVFKSMPAWKPGMQRGKAVRVKLHVPVEFKLGEE
jgi:TonB family protein